MADNHRKQQIAGYAKSFRVDIVDAVEIIGDGLGEIAGLLTGERQSGTFQAIVFFELHIFLCSGPQGVILQHFVKRNEPVGDYARHFSHTEIQHA